MSCTNYCCGFLALSGTFGLGALTVSHGLGSCQYDPLIFPEEDLFKGGYGRQTRISARAPDPPKTIIRYPGKKPKSKCD